MAPYKQTGSEEPRGAVVTTPTAIPALTSANAVAAPTQAEFNALRADVVALQTALTTLRSHYVGLLTNLRDTNTID